SGESRLWPGLTPLSGIVVAARFLGDSDSSLWSSNYADPRSPASNLRQSSLFRRLDVGAGDPERRALYLASAIFEPRRILRPHAPRGTHGIKTLPSSSTYP